MIYIKHFQENYYQLKQLTPTCISCTAPNKRTITIDFYKITDCQLFISYFNINQNKGVDTPIIDALESLAYLGIDIKDLSEINNGRFKEAKYQGRDVELNKPTASDRDDKKFMVYVKDGDKVKKIYFRNKR